MKETEIGDKVVQFFQLPGNEVFCEVPCAGIIDVVIKQGTIIIAIECKVSFGLSVIEQAAKNLYYSHYSYVAVPQISRGSFAYQICKEYGIGILTTGKTEQSNVCEALAPRLHRRITRPKLPEFCKLNRAGVQSDRWTSFSWFVETMKRELSRHPDGLTHKQVFDKCGHYTSAASLKSSLLKYVRTQVITGIEFRDGHFFLTSAHQNVSSKAGL
ncbi:hypothetical protein [Fibrella forsythiae]|uniref:Uncharacterized protein n=1 Tax=Fibrella forsythiae TaxID=2817061 RepID=A0ABS3JCZ9_9BACT|nr:hypothetical protein [Fibrella forsythiae]MBO0947323.1 hypothetical protein [Fibrella forsythiae]